MKSAFNQSVLAGSVILAVIFLIGLTAPFLGTRDPSEIDPISRNKRPGAVRVPTGADGQQRSTQYWMGTDSLGRDIYSRVLYGARVSMLVGISVALISIAAGLVTLSRAGLRTVIVAIVIPEVPRVTRLVRAVVLSIRKQSGENTVAVVDALRERVKEIQATLPPAYKLQVVRDNSETIRTSVSAPLGARVRTLIFC